MPSAVGFIDLHRLLVVIEFVSDFWQALQDVGARRRRAAKQVEGPSTLSRTGRGPVACSQRTKWPFSVVIPRERLNLLAVRKSC
jgi:hypothetical protein